MRGQARAEGLEVTATDDPAVATRAVAHSLKQPLAVAWGYLELVLVDHQARLSPTTFTYLREIQAALEAMDHAVATLDRQ